MITTASHIILSRRIQYIITAILLFMGAMAPSLVHMAGGRGVTLLPIFFALSLGAATLSLPCLLILAVIVPVSNAYLFGMPSAPMLYFLIVEGFIFSTGIVFARRTNWAFPVIFVLSFLMARIVGGLLLFTIGGASSWYHGIFQGIPGLIINVFLGSLFYFIAKKANRV
ncbi:MAG: hypothetical protein ACRCY4_07670 [Brevinema sp.]